MTFTQTTEQGTTSPDVEADEVGHGILLIYLLLDESASMTGDRIDRINTEIPKLHEFLRGHPAVSDQAHLGIIVFSDDATTLLDPSNLGHRDSLPGVTAHGNTNYVRAFAQVRACIARDVAALKADGHQVYRPTVIFMSDGQPNVPGWEAELDRLLDPSWDLHPNIVAFGVGEAGESVIRRVGNARAFIQSEYTTAPDALGTMMHELLNSIVNSATSGNGFQAPTQVAGFNSLV
jgi:uncharacterized protein YegL